VTVTKNYINVEVLSASPQWLLRTVINMIPPLPHSHACMYKDLWDIKMSNFLVT